MANSKVSPLISAWPFRLISDAELNPVRKAGSPGWQHSVEVNCQSRMLSTAVFAPVLPVKPANPVGPPRTPAMSMVNGWLRTAWVDLSVMVSVRVDPS